MEKREIHWKRLIQAILIGTLIFFLGFVITTSISYLQFQRISTIQEETTYNIFKDKLNYEFFKGDICKKEFFSKISEELGFQGVIIDDLEKRLGKENQKVLLRKKLYTLVEVEHFEFVNNLNTQCNSNISTILFFYSNEKSNLDKSEETGMILDSVYRRNDNLIIYSFDINLNDQIITQLKEKYKIKTSPTVIINNNKKLENPSIDEIGKYLNSDNSIIWLN
jgi:hypothetical protein